MNYLLLRREVKIQASSQGAAAAKAALLMPHMFFLRVQIFPFLTKSSSVLSSRLSPTGTLSSSSTRTLVSDRTCARTCACCRRTDTPLVFPDDPGEVAALARRVRGRTSNLHAIYHRGGGDNAAADRQVTACPPACPSDRPSVTYLPMFVQEVIESLCSSTLKIGWPSPQTRISVNMV